ncbi:hypothetical protein N7490_005124 [Penicillium lividum]|nr:hypothetical protein N7490_005124 [Penicillium lividum]
MERFSQGQRHVYLGQLIHINIIIFILNVAIVAFEYVGLHAVQLMFKPVAYSIKLKLEYAILGKMVAIARGSYGEDLPSGCGEIISFPSSQETQCTE